MNKKPSKVQGLGLQHVSHPSREGFTVIEVLVAMSIFAIAVLGLAIGAASVLRNNHTSYLHTVATNLAQDKLEQLKAVTPATLTSCPSPCENGLNTKGTTTPAGPFKRSWTVVPNCQSATGLACINVTVEWADNTNRTLTVLSAVKQ